MPITVDMLSKKLELTPHFVDDGDRAVTGGYVGDLLSWVMGRAVSGDAWVTIMNNINVIAVAQLTDVAMVIMAEGVEPSSELIATAKQRGVNLFSSSASGFELCALICDELKKDGES